MEKCGEGESGEVGVEEWRGGRGREEMIMITNCVTRIAILWTSGNTHCK